MAELFELNPEHSTTRLVTREVPTIEEPPDAAFKTVLFLSEGEGRQGEGGLRTQGCFKRSLPDKPLITVITVVLNRAQYLEETILSVVGQTYENVEYIIIDGGSTDGTLDIIRKYEHAIDYWVSEKDAGIYDAMNKGVLLSTGDSVGIINSDDWYELDAIRNVADYNFVSKKIFHGDMKIYKNDEYFYTCFFSAKKIKKGMIFCHPTMFVGIGIYKRYGCFNVTYRIAADWDLMLRFCGNKCDFVYIKKKLANFRLDGKSSKIDYSSSIEKALIRINNNVCVSFDVYFFFDLIKLLIFGRYVYLISIFKNKYLSFLRQE
ncbi:MAG: glycosyltransferase family 2 protein [Candidatus Electronema sp. V4]|uniref:glycosyltransferase family 2 protein n=1 Tax=Candidatus Electronema sp. V4 TaxID=3454756 RepID=UPI004055876F